MRRLGEKYGFETHVVDEVQIDGLPVSSTRVRAAIAAGATFVLALVVLQLCSAVYKKRHEQLENEFDKEEKGD